MGFLKEKIKRRQRCKYFYRGESFCGNTRPYTRNCLVSELFLFFLGMKILPFLPCPSFPRPYLILNFPIPSKTIISLANLANDPSRLFAFPVRFVKLCS